MSPVFRNSRLRVLSVITLTTSFSMISGAQTDDDPVESPQSEAEADATEEADTAADVDASKGKTPIIEAEEASDNASRDTETGVVHVGSRAGRHRSPRTFAPTVVISGSDLAGLHGPSLISPAALRGLGPDRALVLVNGKRRHSMAQINVDETVGRGSSGTDMNAIPIGAIERVEIWRDSAYPLYGPGATAGVINVVLKEGAGLEVQATGGIYGENDGNALFGLDRASASINGGFKLGDSGFLNLTLEVRDRGETNRAGIATIESTVDGRAFGGTWWRLDNTCMPTGFAMQIQPCVPVRRLRFGNADGQDYYLFYNGAYDITESVSVYSFGGASRRIGNTGAGLFLGVGNGRVPAELYPDGFLPTLSTTIDDLSATAGVRFGLGGPWQLDLSGTYGQSRFNYDVENSVNTSWFYETNPATGEIFAQSPTEANAGKLINTEISANLELSGELDVLDSDALDIALGAEFRVDNYQIVRGDLVSYAYGRGNMPNPDDPIINRSSFPLMEPVVGGIQGFPGFGPDAEVDGNRLAWAAYLDAEQHLTDWWLLGASGRFESVEFTGENVAGRLATRFDFGDVVALRGSASNGSRSPKVQQIYYSQRLTAILPSGLTETATIGDANPLRGSFGMPQLKPERSLSFSGGIVFTPDFGGATKSLTVTADAYRITIADRIILSESITGEVPPGETDTPGRQQFRQLLDDNRLGAAQFFANSVDTDTRGIDLTAAWALNVAPGLGLDLGGAFYYAETRIAATNSQALLVTDTDLFGPVQRNRLQKGEPHYTASVSQVTSYDPVAFRLALNYYGSVTGKAYMALEDEKVWGGKWLTDASISYAPPLDGLLLTLGANNLFDVLPDEWGDVGREYPEIGYTYGLETLPFGVNGGFYYLSARYAL